MESDYGWSAIEDDSGDEYIGHDNTDAIASIEKTSLKCGTSDDIHSSARKSGKVSGCSSTRSCKVLKSNKNGVKRKRRRLTGTEEFLQLILSWNIEKLLLNSRKEIGLAPLAEMPSYFTNGLLYYDTMRQVAVEEARACLSQGLISTLGKMELMFSKVDSCVEDGHLVLILFRILKGGLELTRPGSVFKLFSSSGNIKKGDCLGNKELSNNLTPSNASNSAVQQKVDTTLAVVAQGSQAMKLAASSGGFSSAIPLWIHSTSILGKQLFSNDHNYDGSHWTAVSIGSVLSYQRMAAVCSDSPSPPFMSKLLGHRPISHIKFDSDSDGDGESTMNMNPVRKRYSPVVDVGPLHDGSEIISDSSDDTDSVSSEDTTTSLGFMSHLSAKSSNKLRTLNESQLSALHACLGEEGNGAKCSAVQTLRVHAGNLHLILGPPGCGKTHFLVAMLHALIARSSFSSKHGDGIDSGGDGDGDGDSDVKTRIMVCAPSNKAVCVVLEQFLHSGVVGGPSSRKSGKEVGWVRCALIGVMDKLEGCSSDGPRGLRDQLFPCPLLPAAITDLTQRFLHPFCAADVFVSTYAKGISDALSAVMQFLTETVTPQMLALSNSGRKGTTQSRTPKEFVGGVMHLRAVLGAIHSELRSLIDLVANDADYFYKKKLKFNWLQANGSLEDLHSALTHRLIDPPHAHTGSGGCDDSDSHSDSDSDSDQDVKVADSDHVSGAELSSCELKSCASTTSDRQDISQANDDLYCDRKGVESVKKRKDNGTEGMLKDVDTEEGEGGGEEEGRQQRGTDGKSIRFVETEVDRIASLIRNLRSMRVEMSTPSAGEELAAAVLRSSAIVFCTLTSAGSGMVKKNVYGVDVLVVDEAAQALEVELLIPLSVCPKNLILVGDPKQLPACVLSMENQHTRRGESAMQRLMERCAYPSLLLDTQYRMHPAISMLPNRLFYEGRLFDSDHLVKRDDIFSAVSRSPSHHLQRATSTSPMAANVVIPAWLQNYAFIDVPGGEMGGGQGGTSISNNSEAVAIVKLATLLKQQWGLNLRNQVCVITFYAGQVICINRALKSSGMGGDGLRVMTVDSFQGSECDVVILSFVRSNARGSVGFVSNFQRLNVALTRAKHLLLCVGCANTLQRVAKKTVSNTHNEEGTQYLAEIIKDARLRNRLFLESALFR